MPLVRYEVRCEHSLANSDLYRSAAARDDPEGLLEGVAMAGLVGIVRQLGDLAEFAAEIFRDLHEELTAVGGRTHDLTVRVQQLEAELPTVEKTLLSEPNQLRFAYTNGADWHASIRSDQNHCTSGDLPGFVRNYYEKCRGPPRVFLLDKFDVAGPGSCMKRYTDPSFFKLEWASTELMKAQRAQRDKKARLGKKKARRTRTGQPISGIYQIPARVRYNSASLEDLVGLPRELAATLRDEVPLHAHLGVNRKAILQKSERSAPGPQVGVAIDSSITAANSLKVSILQNDESSYQASKPLNISAKDIENVTVHGKFYSPGEVEGTAESVAHRISKIIAIGDSDSVPTVSHLPRVGDSKGFRHAYNLDAPASAVEVLPFEIKSTKQLSKEDLEAAAMAQTRRTSRTSRGNISIDAREETLRAGAGKSEQGSMSDTKGPTNLQAKASRKSYSDVGDPAQSRKPPLRKSRRSSTDITESSYVAGRSKKIPRASDGFVDVPYTMQAAGDSHIKALAGPIGDNNTHPGVYGIADLNLMTLKEDVEAERNYLLPGVDLLEQPQSLPTAGNSASVLDIMNSRADEQHELRTEASSLDHASTVSVIVEESPPPSPSVGKSVTAEGNNGLVQESMAQSFKKGEGVFTASKVPIDSTGYDVQAFPVAEVYEPREGSERLSVMATSPTGSSLCSSSSTTSPALPSHGERNLQPSSSMLPHHICPNELSLVRSNSECTSSTLPLSPAFDALYSPPGSPFSTSNDFVQDGNPSPMKIPVVPISTIFPETPLTSASLAEFENQAGPTCPPIVIPEKRHSSDFGSADFTRQSRAHNYSLITPTSPDFSTSSMPDDRKFSPSEGLRSPISPQQKSESTDTQPAHHSPGLPDSSLYPASRLDSREANTSYLESTSMWSEQCDSPQSNPLTPIVTESPRQLSILPLYPVDSLTTQDYADSTHLPSPHHSPGSHDSPSSMADIRVPFEESMSQTELARSGVWSEVGSPSYTPQSNTTTPAYTEPVRTSLKLLPGATDCSDSSAPTTPVRSSEQSFQHIHISSPNVQTEPSTVEHAVKYAPLSSLERDESEPSSPSGSVIVKDSPPGSPASDHSASESERVVYQGSPSQPQSLFSHGSVGHEVEDGIICQQKFSGKVDASDSPRSNSSHSPAPIPDDVRRDLLMSPASKAPENAVDPLPENPSGNSLANIALNHSLSQEKLSLPSISLISSQSTSVPASPPSFPEIITLRQISTVRSMSRSHNSSASNSPPDSPPVEEDNIAMQDGPRSSRNRGTQPDHGVQLLHAVPVRSPSNSPPISPPRSVRSETNCLVWRGRLLPAPPEPSFVLPPNLVCQSESSSPPYSPSPQSYIGSPENWVARSGSSDSSDSSSSSVEFLREGTASLTGIYRLPDPPLSPNSPVMSDEGVRRNSFEANGDRAEMVFISRGRSGPQLSSSSSEASLSDLLSSMPAKPVDTHVTSAATESELRIETMKRSRTDLPRHRSGTSNALREVEDSKQFDSLSQKNVRPPAKASMPPAPPVVPGCELQKTSITKDSLAAAIAQQDRTMLNVLALQEPVEQLPPDRRSELLEEPFDLPRTDSIRKELILRPVQNINVAAILEKANAIRQAFVGSDDDEDDEDDWSDNA